MPESRPKVSLTGIKPTGEPHLGNLIGAIRPGLELAETYDSIYFIADYHALTTVRDRAELRHASRQVAATWLAAGLKPERTVMYVQSDVPETFELAWALSCVTAKGLMNRAHAYKAARDANIEAGQDPDAGINMGLYNYPVLMAADILLMETDVVPVGRDQLQHVEIAADVAGTFNHLYGDVCKLKVPAAVIPSTGSGQVLPGLDGRKMSKSYGNTIPLLAPENQLKKLVRRMPTDSTPVEAPKDPDTSPAFQILEQFATGETAATLVPDVRKRLETGGMGWGELKNVLFEVLNTELTPLRSRYAELMEPGSELDDILADGARRARERAGRVLGAVRAAVGVGA